MREKSSHPDVVDYQPVSTIPPQYEQHIQSQFIAPMNYGPDEMTTTCSSCRYHGQSRIVFEATWKTHLCALVLIPCCCMPYCFGACQNINHYCDKCKTYLGTYK